MLLIENMEAIPEQLYACVMGKISMPDLEIFKQKAIELGAAGAEIIETGQLIIDERVRLKCTVPRCQRAGQTPNCPPYLPDLDFIRRAFARYSFALLIKTLVGPVEQYIPGHATDKSEAGQAMLFHHKTNNIVYEIEKMACASGYYLAMGLGGGSCKDYLCHGQTCQYIESGNCRFPHRSRPAMEAMGIDVFDIIRKVGWDAPTALDHPDKIPCATSVGLIFIY